MGEVARDGILGHHFNKRLEYVVFHSPFNWRILKKTILYYGFNNPPQKICEKSRVFS
jgi:hypothetical protein